jgi:YtxH-like protein
LLQALCSLPATNLQLIHYEPILYSIGSWDQRKGVTMRRRINNLLKSVLKTAVYLLEESGDTANDVRDRVSRGFDRAGDRISDLGERTRDLYTGENYTMRSALMFGAGLALGVGAGLLLAPASGEETRGAIGDKVEEFRGQVRDRFSSSSRRSSATGTEGV